MSVSNHVLSLMPQQAVIQDIEFLKMITKGHASAYTIYAFMKKQAEVNEKQKVISYKNVAERMLRLVKDGLIEEAEIDGKHQSIHGRKDYRLTWNGIMNLIPSLNKEDIKTLIGYLSKTFGDESFGQGVVGILLLREFNDVNILLDEYSKHINIPEFMRLKRALMKYPASSGLKEVYRALGMLYESEQFVQSIEKHGTELMQIIGK